LTYSLVTVRRVATVIVTRARRPSVSLILIILLLVANDDTAAKLWVDELFEGVGVMGCLLVPHKPRRDADCVVSLVQPWRETAGVTELARSNGVNII
jgi:hypothetical protein